MARCTKAKLWSKAEVQREYQLAVQRYVPPARVTRLFNELLEAKVVTVKVERDANGQIVSETRTMTVDRHVQLRTLRFVLERIGLMKSKRSTPEPPAEAIADVAAPTPVVTNDVSAKRREPQVVVLDIRSNVPPPVSSDDLHDRWFHKL